MSNRTAKGKRKRAKGSTDSTSRNRVIPMDPIIREQDTSTQDDSTSELMNIDTVSGLPGRRSSKRVSRSSPTSPEIRKKVRADTSLSPLSSPTDTNATGLDESALQDTETLSLRSHLSSTMDQNMIQPDKDEIFVYLVDVKENPDMIKGSVGDSKESPGDPPATYEFQKIPVSTDLLPPGYMCVRKLGNTAGYALAYHENKKLSVTPWYGYAWHHTKTEVCHDNSS
jgi:hypothetical protein